MVAHAEDPQVMALLLVVKLHEVQPVEQATQVRAGTSVYPTDRHMPDVHTAVLPDMVQTLHPIGQAVHVPVDVIA